MQGTNGCYKSGNAEFCTCTQDLCNAAPAPPSSVGGGGFSVQRFVFLLLSVISCIISQRNLLRTKTNFLCCGEPRDHVRRRLQEQQPHPPSLKTPTPRPKTAPPKSTSSPVLSTQTTVSLLRRPEEIRSKS